MLIPQYTYLCAILSTGYEGVWSEMLRAILDSRVPWLLPSLTLLEVPQLTPLAKGLANESTESTISSTFSQFTMRCSCIQSHTLYVNC